MHQLVAKNSRQGPTRREAIFYLLLHYLNFLVNLYCFNSFIFRLGLLLHYLTI